MLLHHRAHGAIEDQDALRKQVAQFGAAVRLWAVASGHGFLQFMTGAGAMLKDKDSATRLTRHPGKIFRVGERR